MIYHLLLLLQNEAQKNSPRTGTDEANGTTRISQQEGSYSYIDLTTCMMTEQDKEET